MNSFTGDWKRSGIDAGTTLEPVYDGPVQRIVRPALLRGTVAGRFEADYRSSRGECRVALVIMGAAPPR
jgi:hypothetical protein